MKKDGGSSGGTIRFKEELAHGANAGLDNAVAWLEPLYKKYNKNTDLSYAGITICISYGYITVNVYINRVDLYTLSGVVAIKKLGGPDIGWRAGINILLALNAVQIFVLSFNSYLFCN